MASLADLATVAADAAHSPDASDSPIGGEPAPKRARSTAYDTALRELAAAQTKYSEAQTKWAEVQRTAPANAKGQKQVAGAQDKCNKLCQRVMEWQEKLEAARTKKLQAEAAAAAKAKAVAEREEDQAFISDAAAMQLSPGQSFARLAPKFR